MKSIIYILLTVFIASIVVTALPKSNANHFQVISIESVEKNPDSIQLYQSASIIKNRLSDYGLDKFEIRMNKDKHEIDILLEKDVNGKEILPVILSMGKIGFYETIDKKEVLKLKGPGDSLLQLLDITCDSTTLFSSPILGYCKIQNMNRLVHYLTDHYASKALEEIKFAWGNFPDTNGNYALYLLKVQASLSKEQLQQAVVIEQTGEKNPELMLVFKDYAAAEWSNLTKNNIGKSIALLIDDKVYYAPTVKSEIKEGKCIISGNFAVQEIKYIQSVMNNKILPLEFKLIE